MASLIVKISHGTEIRRFTWNNEPPRTWPALSKRVGELFELPKHFKLTYVDDEGDRITLSSDDELSEAVNIALASSPAVLRLAVVVPPKPTTTTTSINTTDVVMSDASTEPEAKATTADAGTHAKPATADAATYNNNNHNIHNLHNTTHSNTPSAMPGAAMPGATTGGTPFPPGSVPDEYHALFNSLAAQLPGLAAQLPEAVRVLLPHAELDHAATLAANAAANASCAAAEAMKAAAAANNHHTNGPPMAEGFAPMAGAHPGVRCDRTGQSPILGNRYNLVGHNYDLCEAEFLKLSDKEKALYIQIPPPAPLPVHTFGTGDPTTGGGKNTFGGGTTNNINAAAADPYTTGIHPGVECDRSGVCPIVGIRYNLKGHDYDLCQAEFDKLPSTEKLKYTPIPPRAICAAAAAATAAGGGAMDINDVDTTTPEGVKLALASMGFTDESMVNIAVNKHGPDLQACARDLVSLTSEWQSLLDDLADMGFANRDLNKTLILQHDGNLKRTVKALVEDA